MISTSKFLIAALAPIVCFGAQSNAHSKGEPAHWSDATSMMACAPEQLEPGGKLEITLGPRHGRELAIRRERDGVWFFLVVRLPPKDMKLLMSPEALEEASVVDIPASVIGHAWEAGRSGERIFDRSGEYSVFISENLESEIGGYTCKVAFKEREADG